MSQDVATARISADDLRNITSFEDAARLAAEQNGGELFVASEELGDGFALLENKDQLIDVPLVIMDWSFHEGDHGEFVSAHVVTRPGDKFIVNDGSTGIYAQLRAFSDARGKFGGLAVNRGLRRSDYTHPVHGPATTYYLSTSA